MSDGKYITPFILCFHYDSTVKTEKAINKVLTRC